MSYVVIESRFSAWPHHVLCRHALVEEELPTPRHTARLYLQEHLAVLFSRELHLLNLSSPSVPHCSLSQPACGKHSTELLAFCQNPEWCLNR